MFPSTVLPTTVYSEELGVSRIVLLEAGVHGALGDRFCIKNGCGSETFSMTEGRVRKTPT